MDYVWPAGLGFDTSIKAIVEADAVLAHQEESYAEEVCGFFSPGSSCSTSCLETSDAILETIL